MFKSMLKEPFLIYLQYHFITKKNTSSRNNQVNKIKEHCNVSKSKFSLKKKSNPIPKNEDLSIIKNSLYVLRIV